MLAKQVGGSMKKLKILISISILLIIIGGVAYFIFYGGSNSDLKINIKQDIKNDDEQKIDFKVGVFDNKRWDEKMGTADVDCVPDKDTAIQIANTISYTFTKEREPEKYEIFSVFYDKQDSIWIVSYGIVPPKKGQIIFGGGFNIAIRKKDAKVLRIWFEE